MTTSSEMENFFVSEDVWEAVEKGVPDQLEVATPAAQKQHKENKKKDATALRYIKQGRINRSSSQPIDQAFQSKLYFSNNKANKQEQAKKGGSFQKKMNGQPNQNEGEGKANQRGENQQQRSGNPQQRSNNYNSSCRIYKRSYHQTKDCRFKCKKCRNPNHSQRDCWFQQKKESAEANFTTNEPEQLFSCMNVQQESQDVWYLDSGCSNHMTGNRDIFVELDQNFASQVKLGDGKLQSAKGKGVISVRTKGGNSKLIGDVLYVPNLAQNLLCSTPLHTALSLDYSRASSLSSDSTMAVIV